MVWFEVVEPLENKPAVTTAAVLESRSHSRNLASNTMHSIMRAILLQGTEQHSSNEECSVGGALRIRQVIVQEEGQVIMNSDERHTYSIPSTQLAIQSANNHDIVEYFNNSLATTECRLSEGLKDALQASQNQLAVTLTAHIDQRANEIEGRLQEMLQINHSELEDAAASGIQQRAASIETQLAASLTQKDISIRNQLFQLASDCEKQLQFTREQCETIVAASTKTLVDEQTALIGERLELSLAEKYTVVMDSKLKEITSAISRGVTKNNECILDQVSTLRTEFEENLQITREQCEKIAANSGRVSAEEQAALIEERMNLLLSEHCAVNGRLEQEQFAAKTRSESFEQASMYAQAQTELIEKRLQQKLDAALASMAISRQDDYQFVKRCVKKASTSLGRQFEEIESKQEARLASIETRMQQIISDAEATKRAVATFEEKVRVAAHGLSDHRNGTEKRFDQMKSELEQKIKSASIDENQWQLVKELIDDKLNRFLESSKRNDQFVAPQTLTQSSPGKAAIRDDTRESSETINGKHNKGILKSHLLGKSEVTLTPSRKERVQGVFGHTKMKKINGSESQAWSR
ncbi:hypothetical protein DVH05_026981 [Phytophthora capsici]|nr:hypothetical protein DVH05_016192 [Phytophthora capsici]KAG1691317.1 hypothetical protein DVH05_026981 [Phytophthora capsici]